ncbi:MAG: DUF423 domain-containing protein [Halofilum sp. (in: g-proteobacteria)]
MLRWALIAAAASGMAAVMIGASGAHALGDLPASARNFFETAERYHFVHTLALALAALAPAAGAHRSACQFACAFWLAGMIIFCGSLYLLALTGTSWLGAFTPFGGTAIIAGWIALILAAALRPD